MATIKISKREIEKFIKLDQKNLEKMNLMGIPVEAVHADEIELEVLPNRPDVLSIQGYLRALKAYFEVETGLKKYAIKKLEKNFKVTVDKSVKSVRPFTACAIVKGLKFDDSKIKEIMDLQEKLHLTLGRSRKKAAIGIYPLEKIMLPIKYEARKPQDIRFIPLESDEEMNGLEILQLHPTGREYASLLEGQKVFPVFVDANDKILSMPPLINSHETGRITGDTKEVFIECSGFDLYLLKKILNMVVTTLIDMGGEAYQMEISYSTDRETTPNLEPENMKISLENVNKLIGLNLAESDLSKLLPRMGYDYKKGIVSIPAWRTDILHEVDIIEDIAIAYGYDNLIPEIPQVATIGEESKESKVKSKISDILTGLGLMETSSYHLIKEDEAKKSKLSEKIEVENSRTEYKILRPNLLVPSLRILSENKDADYPQKIFEMGTTFTLGKTETGIKESENLIISCIPSNFTELKQTLDYLMRMLSIEYKIKDSPVKSMIDGRTASIIINSKEVGFIGEVHPEILDNWNIKQPLAVIEMSLDEIFNHFK
ncbi:MAG: phenylalanine--tRNA ligase subunit beta [Nanoarchaeota archaeon]|nr:phenylalanine--tRNA ligase subunit beta [Nanoarchaeota archaeon]